MPAHKLVPELRHHAPTRQWYVWAEGKRHYLGADREAAEARRLTLFAGALAPAMAAPPADPTVTLALRKYLDHADAYYAAQPRTVARIEEAVTAAVLLFGPDPASRFRGPQLKKVREYLLTQRASKRDGRPLSRTYVNALVGSLQRGWWWLASEDLVPADGLTSILAVERLRKGRGGRETGRVSPPPPGWEQSLAVAPPTVRDMVTVQLLAAMRPQDVCRLTRARVSVSPGERVELPESGRTVSAVVVGGVPVWVYAPADHKTSWQDRPRVVCLGPRAQEILSPRFADRPPTAAAFRPADALAESRRGVRWAPKPYYTPEVYAQAVERAAKRAGVGHWTPNQLRHLAATLIRERYDRDTAAAVLGHAGGATVDAYLEVCLTKAARVAAETG